LIQSTRFVSTSKLLLLPTIAGFVLGCGEQMGSAPVPTKEEGQKIEADMKKAMQEFRKARGEPTRGGRAGGGP
jgi:hypothetical protein